MTACPKRKECSPHHKCPELHCPIRCNHCQPCGKYNCSAHQTPPKTVTRYTNRPRLPETASRAMTPPPETTTEPTLADLRAALLAAQADLIHAQHNALRAQAKLLHALEGQGIGVRR